MPRRRDLCHLSAGTSRLLASPGLGQSPNWRSAHARNKFDGCDSAVGERRLTAHSSREFPKQAYTPISEIREIQGAGRHLWAERISLLQVAEVDSRKGAEKLRK